MSTTVSRANTLLEERTKCHLRNGIHLGLTFATPKTELLYCLPLNSKNKNKSLSSHPPLRILNTTISAKRQINYLGVFIDESLTFIHHATMAAARGYKILGSLSFLRHRSRGIPANIAHHLAMTAILPAMFWASPAWWTDTPAVSATLSVTYNAIARWITGLPLNTRTTNLITLAHLPPMASYLNYLSLRYAIRLHFLPTYHALGPPRSQPNTHSNLPGLHHLYNLSKHLVQGKLEDRTTTSTAPGVAKTTSPNPDKTTGPQQLHEEWLRTLPAQTIVIYTDGSKLENGTVGCGWAIYHCRNQQLHLLEDGRCHWGNRAEVYDAELHGVQEAVTAVLTTTAPRASVFVCIDNQAAADTLQFNKSNHEYAQRALEVIENLQHLGWHVSTVWCPSHCNIRGNERADTLAKTGASSTVPCRFALTTKAWLFAQARMSFLKRWKQELPLSDPSLKISCPPTRCRLGRYPCTVEGVLQQIAYRFTTQYSSRPVPMWPRFEYLTPPFTRLSATRGGANEAPPVHHRRHPHVKLHHSASELPGTPTLPPGNRPGSHATSLLRQTPRPCRWSQ